MVETSFIIGMIVMAIWFTMQEGEIFGFMQRYSHWKIAPALFDCPICMIPWHGSILYWVIPWKKLGLPESDLILWPIVIVVAMGVNTAINKLSPKDDSGLDARVDDIEETLKDHGIYK